MEVFPLLPVVVVSVVDVSVESKFLLKFSTLSLEFCNVFVFDCDTSDKFLLDVNTLLPGSSFRKVSLLSQSFEQRFGLKITISSNVRPCRYRRWSAFVLFLRHFSVML